MLLLPLRTPRPTIPVLPRTRTRPFSFLFLLNRFFISVPHYPLQDIQLRLDYPWESLNNVHLWTNLTAWNHISLVLRFYLLKVIVTSWHSTHIIVHRNTHVTQVMHWGWWRRAHVSLHDGSFWLRHLPPAVGRVWSVVVLGGGREVIGWILIIIEALARIVVDGGWWDGGIVSLHMHFRLLHVRWRQVRIHRIHVGHITHSAGFVIPLVWLSVHQSIYNYRSILTTKLTYEGLISFMFVRDVENINFVSVSF